MFGYHGLALRMRTLTPGAAHPAARWTERIRDGQLAGGMFLDRSGVAEVYFRCGA
jgi:hypothetical protein